MECWIGVVSEGNRRVVRIVGRLSKVPAAELLRACGEESRLELDLTNLVSADTAGIGALQRIRNQGASLTSAPEYIRMKLDTPTQSGTL